MHISHFRFLYAHEYVPKTGIFILIQPKCVYQTPMQSIAEHEHARPLKICGKFTWKRTFRIFSSFFFSVNGKVLFVQDQKKKERNTRSIVEILFITACFLHFYCDLGFMSWLYTHTHPQNILFSILVFLFLY